jgi:hypothetical protein
MRFDLIKETIDRCARAGNDPSHVLISSQFGKEELGNFDMTESEQRIAIAKYCGWIFPECIDHLNAGFNDPVGCPPGKAHTAKVPDFPNDLNAMAMAEACLTIEHSDKYYRSITAWSKAKERAKAFLRTIRKWKESEN